MFTIQYTCRNFFKQKFLHFRNHGNIFIEKLLRNKILFFNPRKLLYLLIKYPYITSWWSSDKIQAVRKEILAMHFNTSKDWADDWCKKLL